MAVAEARAAWQRTANRCFVQEDAKRAPKLACCPSTSTSAFKQTDASQSNPDEEKDNPNAGFIPPNKNPSHKNLPTESKWWLQMQPNYIHHMNLVNEQLKILNLDMEETLEVKKKEFDDENDEVYLDSESGPWWKTADSNDLAWFVATRSQEYNVQNCDLPQPQKTGLKMDPFTHIGSFDGKDTGIGFFSPEKDIKSNKARSVSLPNPILHKRSTVSSESDSGRKWWTSVDGYSHSAREKPLSEYISHKKEKSDMHIDGNSKAELLEALLHSQTRARKAEEAAKQAYEEKEHILKLLFQQASHLFAYKQWLQILQLESFYYQLKYKNEYPVSTLPFLDPPETQSMKKKSSPKPKKAKRAKRMHFNLCSIIGKYAFFALGLGLVGAGLLLGWTIGWMLPPF